MDIAAYQSELEAQDSEIRRQKRQLDTGREPIGVYSAKDFKKVIADGWQTIRRDRAEAARTQKQQPAQAE